MVSRPAHGGYPTPTYDQASVLRRRLSTEIWGHPGSHVFHAVTNSLWRAAYIEKMP